MAATGTIFREIKHSSNQKWKDISVSIVDGGSVSSYIQEHKVLQRAGGYGYNDSGRAGRSCRNRFIFWRCYQDVLELVEESLDFDLKGNGVRFRFNGAAVFGDVNIHESHGNVVVLVTTTTSVHRLIFPHPNRLQNYESSYVQGAEKSVPSIFTDASVTRVQDPANSHNFNLIGLASSYQIHAASSWLTNEGEAIFAMATSIGSILMVKLPPYGIQGIATQHELKQSSMIQRLWGAVPSVIRGGNDLNESTTSLILHRMGSDIYVFAVSRDHKLRMWSCKNYDCVMAADLLDFMPNNADPATLTIGDEGHMIRKSVASSIQTLFLGVFMSFSDRCQFCVFQPVFADGRFQLNHMTAVFGPQDDMIDFCLTESNLWTLWTSNHGETYASCASIEYNRPGIQNLRTIILETSEPSELEVPGHLEPRQYYIDQVFYPGNFSTLAIMKALNIFKRSLDNTRIPDTTVPLQALKTEVIAVVEHEIHNSASDYDISEEEYQQLQLQQWAKFYSCCVQYQQRSSKALGIFADNSSGMVSVVKRDLTSYYRPCDNIEHLSLTPLGACHVEDFDPNLVLWEDEPLFRDMIQLCECLKLMRLCLTDEMIYSFEQDLYHAQRPITVAESIVMCIKNDTEYSDQQQAMDEVVINLQHVQDLDRSVRSLIELLDLVHKPPDNMAEEMGVDESRQLSLSRLFASSTGVSLVSRALQQMAQSRLDLSRDLLLLLTMATQMADQVGLSESALQEIEMDLLSKACVLVRAYFIVKWSTEVLATSATSNQADANVHLLEALGLLESVGTVTPQKLNDCKDTVLLELFLHASGGQKVKELLVLDSLFDEDPCTLWAKALMPVVTATAQMLWPYNSFVVFPEFLISYCQYTALQDYVRLTQDWCDINALTRRFFLGLAYFSSGEAQKAVDCFLEVPLDVTSEDFLLHLVAKEDIEDSDSRMVYYIKILAVLEQFQFPHLAVSIAKKAISVARQDDAYVPTLWSKVFKNELEMGHNEDAYTAMLSNPDKDRRRDCLRQFLVVLCERSELQTLVSLPYRDRHVVLEDEVVSILESRARSIDLNKQNYYDLLYAFHVFRQNYRKAGSIMYEYGMRLGQEVSGLKGMQKQAKCYLAALNALRLVNPDYAWIVKPLSASRSGDDGGRQSPKRDIDGEEFKFSKRRQIGVLELDDIEKEYMLVHARLQLLQNNTDTGYITGPTASTSETIGLLISAGLFDSAINICKMFKLPLTPVFDGLASRCVNLAENSHAYMQGDNEYTSEAWKWLKNNELTPANAIRETCSTDHAWRFLQHYLTTYEDGTSLYHKSVAVKFLSQGFELPTWLAESYKRMNAAELLRLYLDYDLLEEASLLTLEYIDAVMGKGKEYFGLKTYLHTGAPAVWLPYTSIDQLLTALDEVQTEPHYTDLYHKIQDKIGKYFDTLESVTQDSIQAESMKLHQSMHQGYSLMES